MFEMKNYQAGALLAVALSLGAAPDPALARGGDITRGLLLGLVGGYAVDEYIHHARRWSPETEVSAPVYVQQPTSPVYFEQPGAGEFVDAPSSPDSRAFISEDRQVRIAIQYNLMQAGFYTGAIDGVWGPMTEEAVFHYARAHDQTAMLTTEEEARQLFATILR